MTITDAYGRTITITHNVEGQDIYAIEDGGTFAFPTETPQEQALLSINGMSPEGFVPQLSKSDLVDYLYEKVSTISAIPRSYNVNLGIEGMDALNVYCDAMPATGANLTWLVTIWGAANPPPATTQWNDDLGIVTPITLSQIVSMATQMGAYMQSIWNGPVATANIGIANSTITTKAQIDAFSWPV